MALTWDTTWCPIHSLQQSWDPGFLKSSWPSNARGHAVEAIDPNMKSEQKRCAGVFIILHPSGHIWTVSICFYRLSQVTKECVYDT